MKPADDIRKLFKDAGLRVESSADEQVFEDMVQAQHGADENPKRVPDGWRRTMRNPITKIAIAAGIVIACTVGLFLWTGTGSGVALADVLTRIQQVSAYMYQMSGTASGQATTGTAMDQNVHATILLSQECGMKMTMEMTDPNGTTVTYHEQYILPQKKSVITIMPKAKKYMQIELDDTQLENIQKQNNDPGTMVKQILECERESLGKSTLDGIAVEGFRTTDPAYLGSMAGEVDARIWVDVKTQLPVRTEIDMQMGEMHMHAVAHDFEWNVSVDADEFEPVIPEDYTALSSTPLKMPATSEETALQGLRLAADLTGRYPEQLDFMTLTSYTEKLVTGDTPVAQKLRKERAGLERKESIAKIAETIMPIQGIGIFYRLLTAERKDPAYYGEIVCPEDKELVLMRWKASDSEYRVIFGDLHAETVTAETLAELEAALPK